MNIQSVLNYQCVGDETNRTSQLAHDLKTMASTLVMSIKASLNSLNDSTSGKKVAYQVGQSVYHDLYSSGKVIAQWPDGRLLVKFEGQAKNQLVFPSFLSRTNSHRS